MPDTHAPLQLTTPVRPLGLRSDARSPPPASAHSPDSGEVAGPAMHLKHPTVVGKQQFQGLAEDEDAQHPDPGGEDGHAEERLRLWGLVGATSVREGRGLQGPLRRAPEVLTAVSMAVNHLGGGPEEPPPWAYNKCNAYARVDTGPGCWWQGEGCPYNLQWLLSCVCPAQEPWPWSPPHLLWWPRFSPLREVSLDVTDQPHRDVHVAVGGTHCCHDDNQPAGRATGIHTPKDAILWGRDRQ